MTAPQGGERTQATVLLADHRVHGQRAFEAHPGVPQGPRHREVGGDAGLHVAGAAAEERVVADLRTERVGEAPRLDVARRYDVGVAAQDQSGSTLPRRRTDHADGRGPLDLDAGEPRVGGHLLEVDVPTVHVGVEVTQRLGDVLLHLDLCIAAADAGDPDQLDQALDEDVRVEVVEHGAFER